jgi:acyl-CoA-binding protein
MSEDLVKLVGAGIVSLALLGAGFYVLFHQGSSGDLQKAATGWIGLVAGYWLK